MISKSRPKIKSAIPNKTPKNAATAKTSIVNRIVSFIVGHVTLRNSPTISPKNRKFKDLFIFVDVCFCCILPDFSMKSMYSTPRTIFLQFDTLRIIPTTFG